MVSRPDLQKTLEVILGARRVYFQPPESVKLSYPCIIYEEDRGKIRHANDRNYLYRKAYSITVIDKNPDSPLPDKIRDLHLVDAGRPFKADNLYHWQFTIYI